MKVTKGLMLSASFTALGVATPAIAQGNQTAENAAEAGTTSSNAIVVTATRREETLQEVPVAVSVVSGERLDAVGVSAVDAIVDVSPSITFTRGNNSSSSSVNIRGIGTTVFASAVEPSVSVVVDDVVMGRAGMGFQDLIDVQRVEVLRGPQSTLFGKNASAGVVSVTTQSPTSYFSGSADVTVTEDGEFQQRATISGPLSETAGIRLSGFYKDFDGNTLNFFDGERLNGFEAWGLRGKLEFMVGDALELTFIGDYRDSDATPIATIREYTIPANGALIAPAVPGEENTQVNADGEVFSMSEQFGFSGRGVYEFDSGFELTSITAYREWSFDNNVDVDNTSLSAPDIPFTWNINRGATDMSQISQELRLASPEWDNFDFLVGAYYFNLDLTRGFSRRWVFATGGRSNSFTGQTETTNLGGFVSGNIYFDDNFSAFGGLRLVYEKLDWDVFRDPSVPLVPGDTPLPGAQGSFADFDGSTEDTELIGNIGLRYEIDSVGNIYASYSRGYKGAGFNLVFGAQPGDPVEPETVDAYELGLKVSTFDDVLSANIALFYSDYSNFQAQSRGESDIAPFILRNAGGVSTKGVEAEFSLRPNELLTASFGAAYVDAKIDSFPGGPCFAGQTAAQGCVNGAQDLAGGVLPNAPEWRFTAFARQTIPIDALPFDAFVQANGTYQSEIQYSLNQDPRTIQDGYAILNAAIGLEAEDGSYSFQIFGRNLTDQFFAGQLFPSPSSGGRVTMQIPRGSSRYFGVRGSVRF